MASILTRKRVTYYCSSLLIAGFIVQIFSTIKSREIGGDFAAFYAEGRVAVEYRHTLLYNVEVQDLQYSKLVGPGMSSPVAFTPWFTIVLALLACLPYLLSFGVWTLLSFFSLMFGFCLIARTVGVPSDWIVPGMLACLAFPPYLFYTLMNGQPAAFALLILAGSYSLHKIGRNFLSGVVLSLLTYKATLILFIGPMLLLTRQWKLLGGVLAGGLGLALISVLWAGIEGIRGFLSILHLYSKAIDSNTEVFQTAKYIDIGAALRLLIGPQPYVRVVIFLLSFPIASFIWYRVGPQPLSWSIAIITGLLVSPYSPIYDCTLLIFAVMLKGIGTIKTWILGVLYFTPVLTVAVARLTGIQLYTLVLAAFLISIIHGFASKVSNMRKSEGQSVI